MNDDEFFFPLARTVVLRAAAAAGRADPLGLILARRCLLGGGIRRAIGTAYVTLLAAAVVTTNCLRIATSHFQLLLELWWESKFRSSVLSRLPSPNHLLQLKL